MRFPFSQLAALGLSLTLAACGRNSSSEQQTAATPPASDPAQNTAQAAALLTPGPWRGLLEMQEQMLPFSFEVKTEDNKPVAYLINPGLNGEERLRCPDITAAGDSAVIRLHVFDAALVVRGAGPGQLKGTWVKYDAKKPYRVPLTAMTAEVALAASATQPVSEREVGNFGGTWRVTFKDETGKTYPAVGVFKANPDKAKVGQYAGTFLTTTGDYRYLTGNASRANLTLSTFDGNHAFIFSGKEEGNNSTKPISKISGDFYAGKSGHETWTAVRDDKAKLPDADTLTYLKKGESRLSFSFPSIAAGQRISPTDAKYRGKVVVLQILGSWCPNCMDETAFLAPWYAANKARGVEVIGLGYERSPEYEKAAGRLRKLKERYDIGYELAVAGVSDKDSVARSLPQLAKFLAFPTTIFLDKKGAVRAIRTGFSGPGTGTYYEAEKAHFNRTVDKLLRE